LKNPKAASRGKYLGLQILRITAACMVVVTHSTFYAHERLDQKFGVWQRGATGVDIFFVLSGFVMIFTSVKLIGNPSGWKIFAEHRIVRIVPMYWIATSIKVIALLVTSGYVLHARFDIAKTLESYLFIPSANVDGEIRPVLGVGWTLNFEMFFYFLFTMALLLRKNVYRLVGFVLTLLAIGAFFCQPNWPPVSFYLSTMVVEFFFGMLIAKMCLSNMTIAWYLALPLLCCSFFFLLTPWLHSKVLLNLPNGIAAGLIVYATVCLEDYCGRVPRLVLYGADASYVIYLFHPLIAPLVPTVLMKMHVLNPWLSVACSVSVALIAGGIVHRTIETPISNWLRPRSLFKGRYEQAHSLESAPSQ